MTASTLRARPIAMKAKLARALERRVLPLLAEGRVRPVIDSIYSFASVRDAHDRMDRGVHMGKIVLRMGGDAETADLSG